MFLEGISLRGAFIIYNPNEQLAINYEVDHIYTPNLLDLENADNNVSMGPILSIFPKSGILLKG